MTTPPHTPHMTLVVGDGDPLPVEVTPDMQHLACELTDAMRDPTPIEGRIIGGWQVSETQRHETQGTVTVTLRLPPTPAPITVAYG